MYKKALKQKLRFACPMGLISTEDLFDLKLTMLDNMAIALDEKISKTPKKSFITNENITNSVDELKLEILKDVINEKLEEKKALEDKKLKVSQKNKLLEILARKKDESLEELSIEELEKKINELS